MHEQVLDVVIVRLFVVVGAEAGKALVAEVCFHRVNATDQHVQSTVKLLLVKDQRVVYIALHEELMMKGALR